MRTLGYILLAFCIGFSSFDLVQCQQSATESPELDASTSTDSSSLSTDPSASIHPSESTTDKPTTDKPTVTNSPEPPSTTVAPTEDPTKAGNWSIHGTDNTICLIAKFSAGFGINYINASGQKVYNIFHMPSSATMDPSSTCNSTETHSQILKLNFDESSLELVFDHADSKVYLANITLEFWMLNFPDSNETTTKTFAVTGQKLFEVGDTHSYLCNKETVVKFDDDNMIFSLVQVEAFRQGKTDQNFALAENCEIDDFGNIVPIVVGCALAGLVVIVLIAYLVGRRHKRQRGYESV